MQVSYERFFWHGLLSFQYWEGEGRIYVFSDGNDPLGDDYAMRPGSIEEVRRDDLARTVIEQAVAGFDHTITFEVLPDGNGNWIPLQTDT